MEGTSIVSLFLVLLVVVTHGSPERIASLKVHSGIKMHLKHKHIPCTESGDATFDRAFCMVKKSLERAAKLKATLLSSGGGISDEYESPLSSAQGDYVTTISIGTPAMEYPVIADTGSDLLWIQCKPCDVCFDQEAPIFDPRNSSSYSSRSCSNDAMCQALPRKGCTSSKECSYAYGYGDGSGTMGTLASESMTLTTTDGEDFKVKNFAFGCGHRNTGKFSNSAGLMGLGRGKLSFVSQLGKLFEDKFSYCLVPWRDDPTMSSPMYFGSGPEDSQSDGQHFQYTPLVKNSARDTFYYVNLLDISIAGQKMNIPSGTFNIKKDGSGGVIFDSGTTLTLLQDDAYNQVMNILQSTIKFPQVDGSGIGLDLCYDVSHPNKENKFPSMTFHFDGADQALPLNNYFITVNKEESIVCLAMAGSGMDIGIIGNIQQQNFHVVYDLDNEKLGWAPTKCD